MEGATAAIGGHLDFFGLMVLAFSTALGGGIVRDLLIGAIPPNSIRDWRYGTTAFLGAAAIFFFFSLWKSVPSQLILVLDAAGLALFAMSGSGKALAYGVGPFSAVLMGTITGVGGGTIRDLFLAHVPAVLRADIYAVAALAGSAVMVVGVCLGGSNLMMSIMGGLMCFALRIVSVWQHWNLPTIYNR